MTNKERFLAGEIFKFGERNTSYQFDGDHKLPAIKISNFHGDDFYFFALIKIGVTQVKWNARILGKQVKGAFKFDELVFKSGTAKGGATE